jgi:hypothetical protein
MLLDPPRRGDVVWALDPYHDDDPLGLLRRGPPWLVINEGGFPVERRYLACALTSTVRRARHRIDLDERDWIRGSAPRPSQLDTTTIMTLKHGWIEGRVGELATPKVARAQAMVKSFL